MFHTEAARGAGALLPREQATPRDILWQRDVPVVHLQPAAGNSARTLRHGLFGMHRADQRLHSGGREGLEPFTLSQMGSPGK